MHRLRQWTIIFIAWLLFIVNVEQSSEQALAVGRSSDANILMWYSYVFIAVVALMTLGVPFLRKLSLRVLLPAIVLLFLIVKLCFKVGHGWEIEDLLRTATELSAIVLTALLARRLNRALGEFQDVVAAITISRVGRSVSAFSTSQGEMYREVRRARQHNRPLTLLALKVKEDSVNVAMHQMVKEVQEAMMEQFVLAGVANALCSELHDYDIIAQQNSHFLVLLPELKKEDLPSLLNRLGYRVSERMGVKLQVGAATLPDNAMTFESLVEQATRQLEDVSWQPSPAAATYPQTVSQQS